MSKQIIITNNRSDVFETTVQRHMDDGWRVVPTTLIDAGECFMVILEKKEEATVVVDDPLYGRSR